MPSHWGLDFNLQILWGHKHSVHNKHVSDMVIRVSLLKSPAHPIAPTQKNYLSGSSSDISDQVSSPEKSGSSRWTQMYELLEVQEEERSVRDGATEEGRGETQSVKSPDLELLDLRREERCCARHVGSL